jgi:hypothetical protein
MAKVEMDLQELKAIENKVKEVKEQANVEKKELQDKIDSLQKEKETFIQNQKRVMLTKRIFDTKQYLPCTKEHLERLFNSILADVTRDIPAYMRVEELNYITETVGKVYTELLKYSTFDKLADSSTPINKEEEYEFINLDDAIQLALKQEDSNYMKELKQLKSENSKLKKDIVDYDIQKEEEINAITERENKRYAKLQKESAKIYEKVVEDNSKKYKALEEESTKKYKALEEEFAKYKDDEAKMSMKDKLEKYQKENDELKKKLNEMDKKLKSKSLFGKIFG